MKSTWGKAFTKSWISLLLGGAAPLDTCTKESNGNAAATSAAMMGGTGGKCVTLNLSMALTASPASNLFMTTTVEPSERSPTAKSERP
uniref:Secreted protein n=1 Tax=Arundo donax TaxID=35708 RepID=A0A0A9ENB7_ARUDO